MAGPGKYSGFVEKAGDADQEDGALSAARDAARSFLKILLENTLFFLSEQLGYASFRKEKKMSFSGFMEAR